MRVAAAMGDETRVAADRSQRREGRPSLKMIKELGGHAQYNGSSFIICDSMFRGPA